MRLGCGAHGNGAHVLHGQGGVVHGEDSGVLGLGAAWESHGPHRVLMSRARVV